MPQMVFGVHFVPQPGKAYLSPTFEPEKISSIIQDFIIWVKIAARKADLSYINILSSSGMKLTIVTLTHKLDVTTYYLLESKHITLSVFYPLLHRNNLN